eukprot:CAMPEP_0113298912 /NCGR_PEP_ID=MMETSP0010_2-20120614/1157_1 /TAXON_ID=216773 ORGANISM="Corethron hystrix, Strain 308" /NCGR_SAMPLE_ID=MMETSP0010_2 /ASSEMBLY_ACC=CAM_ASM_000155 /LENGTH=172 /DNA_ID=CAMNT_0000152041 /DNA_START=605 /DNA_END=1126 /DNA_ORIENTATION=+ /assembly_acc=CAM_ASM_000155
MAAPRVDHTVFLLSPSNGWERSMSEFFDSTAHIDLDRSLMGRISIVLEDTGGSIGPDYLAMFADLLQKRSACSDLRSSTEVLFGGHRVPIFPMNRLSKGELGDGCAKLGSIARILLRRALLGSRYQHFGRTPDSIDILALGDVDCDAGGHNKGEHAIGELIHTSPLFLTSVS